MIVLADQYTKIITYKHRIYYTDFVLESGTRKIFQYLTIPRNFEVIGAKLWLREQFVAVSMTSCNLYLINSQNLAQTGESARSPINAVINVAPSDFSGTIGFSAHPPSNQLADNLLNVRMLTNSISGGAVLTAGYFDLWTMVARLP